MKTQLSNQTVKCESKSNSGLSHSVLWQVCLSTLAARMNRFNQFVRATSLALLASLASLVQEANSNNRLLVALFLMLAVAPLSGSFYIFFDKIDSWFFVHYFNLFIGLRGNLLAFFTILGIFFLFPARYKASYLLAAPLGFVVADIVKKLLATTNTEYNSAPTFTFVVLCLCTVLGVLLSLDWFLYKHHHIKRKYWAHIVGIIKTPGIPAEQKIEILKGEIKSVENNFYSIY